jgi:molybdopterin-guanine dinucleotide biosynthesis protein B
MPLLLGLAGWSGAGKTTLLCALLPILNRAGLRVSTIKHAHHSVALDTPGKDSYRHRQAGAQEVLLATGAGWALFHAASDETLDPSALAARLAPADLVLVEGFRAGAMTKIEVFRPVLGKPPLWPDDAAIAALATDDPAHDSVRRFAGSVFPLNDHGEIARWIMALIALRHG